MNYQTNYGSNYFASSYVASGSLILLCYSLKDNSVNSNDRQQRFSLLERAINKDGINFPLPDHSYEWSTTLKDNFYGIVLETFMLYWLRFYVQEMHEDLLRESISFIREPHRCTIFLLRRIYLFVRGQRRTRWNRLLEKFQEEACDECQDLNDVGLGYGIAHHDLVHEIHYGRGWLLWFQFGEHVALIVRLVRGFPCHESEATTEENTIFFFNKRGLEEILLLLKWS